MRNESDNGLECRVFHEAAQVGFGYAGSGFGRVKAGGFSGKTALGDIGKQLVDGRQGAVAVLEVIGVGNRIIVKDDLLTGYAVGVLLAGQADRRLVAGSYF